MANKKPTALTAVTPQFEELLARAEAGVTQADPNAPIPIPRWFEIWKTYLRNPCGGGRCPLAHKHREACVGFSHANAFGGPFMMSVVTTFILAPIWFAISIPFWKELPAIVLMGYISAALIDGVYYRRHLKEVNVGRAALPPPRPPAELVISYLTRDVERMKARLNGPMSELQRAGLEVERKLADMRAEAEGLDKDIAECRDERFLPSLRAGRSALTELIVEAEKSRLRYARLIQEFDAYFAGVDARIGALATPFRYHHRLEAVARYRNEAPQAIAELEDAMVAAIVELQAYNASLEDKFGAAIATVAATGEQDLEQAFDACEALMETALRDLPALPSVSAS